MKKIKIALAGIGNCASSLIQGLHLYKNINPNEIIPGILHTKIGEYEIKDIEVVAAFDIDKRKVGFDLSEAIYAKPNNTLNLVHKIPKTNVIVNRGPTLDGFSKHMLEYPENERFVESDEKPVNVKEVLRKIKPDMLICYLPVGSQKAVEYYANACLESNTAFINAMPVFICSDSNWAEKFEKKGLICAGDDIKAQIGATILHRVLVHLFESRGVKILRTYQLNFGGNTDFLNMLAKERLGLKKISKTESVQSQLKQRLEKNNIHIGPSDYIPWQKDNKICYIRIEGENFGNAPVTLELKLSVEDSPNSAGVMIDVIRAVKIAMDSGLKGPLYDICSFAFKHPPIQKTDEKSKEDFENFIKKYGKNKNCKSIQY
ncbi:MAG: inositol-3-phosphate synthase [Candidatus Pacearchaeota archaeon]